MFTEDKRNRLNHRFSIIQSSFFNRSLTADLMAALLLGYIPDLDSSSKPSTKASGILRVTSFITSPFQNCLSFKFPLPSLPLLIFSFALNHFTSPFLYLLAETLFLFVYPGVFKCMIQQVLSMCYVKSLQFM